MIAPPKRRLLGALAAIALALSFAAPALALSFTNVTLGP